MTGRRLIALRHGQTPWNESGRAQGHADVSLDAVGREQASQAATYLASLRLAALVSSDLARARETCAYLEAATGLSAKHDERLREFDVGARQGLTFAEFASRFPRAHTAWVRGDPMVRLPGAEGATDVRERMLPALRELLSSLEPGETGVVVTHGASLKVGMVALLGWPADAQVGLRTIDNCAWATLEELDDGGRLRLVGYNERVSPGRLDFASGTRVG